MISVVGHTATDHIFKVPVFPERHSSVPILDHKIYYGGGAANIAAGIAKLGGECELFSAVGFDFSGSEYDLWMDELGIRKNLLFSDDKRTASCYLYNDGGGDQITFFEWGASEMFTTADSPKFESVHMATADPSFNVKVAENSESASFDPGQDLINYSGEQLSVILDNIDILFANQHEMKGMAEKIGISESDIIKSVPVSVVTMSGDGSVIHMGGNKTVIPSVPVTLADPTGAGDAYRAGFLTAQQIGYDPVTCCKIGTVAASFNVESVGPQTNLPDWERMKLRFEEHFGKLEAVISSA
jgi:ribokinase